MWLYSVTGERLYFDETGSTYRAVYTVRFQNTVYVLLLLPEEEHARHCHT